MTTANEAFAKEVVAKTLNRLADSKSVDLTKAGAQEIKPAIVKEMSAVIANKTNQEPWYQSRVTWGAIGAIVLPLLGVIGVGADVIEPDEFVAVGVAAGTVVSGLLTLYGRYVAKKPIGE